MQELNGYWQGYFIYGLGYDLPFFGEKVKLFAELNFENGQITGHFTEEKGAFSMGRTSRLDGFWQEDLVSLNAHYTSNEVVLEDGYSTENLEHNFNIIYNGRFNEIRKTIHGIWYMDEDQQEVEGIEMPVAEGIWMIRKSEKPKSDFDYSLLGL